jgi:hypothetical protein
MEPFDQDVLAPAERPSTEALNRGFTADRRALSFFYERLLGGRTSVTNDRSRLRNGFMGDSFEVRPTSPAGFSLEVSGGLGFYYDPTVPLVIAQDSIVGRFEGVSDVSPWRPLVLGSSVSINIPVAPAVGMSRYDIVEVRPKRELADYGQLLRFDQAVNNFVPKSAPAFLRYGSTQTEVGQVLAPILSTAPLSYKVGIAAPTGTQVEPEITPGYVRVARVLINGGDVSIDSDQITDYRAQSPENGTGFVSGLASIRSVRGQKIRPLIKALNAPSGMKVVVFDRDTISVTGFPISPNIMLFTGAPLTYFTGGVEAVNPIPSGTPLTDNERPVLAHGSAIGLNRFLQGPDIFNTELLDPLTTYPAGKYSLGSYFSSLRPFFCLWDPATNLFDGDMATQDPIEFSFWMAYSY